MSLTGLSVTDDSWSMNKVCAFCNKSLEIQILIQNHHFKFRLPDRIATLLMMVLNLELGF